MLFLLLLLLLYFISYIWIFFLIILKNIFYCIAFTIWVAVVTLYERKLLSLIQQRSGPNNVGYKGRLQFFADSIKLLSKGILLLFSWSNIEIIIMSVVSIFIVYIFWPNAYLDFNCIIVDIEYNIVYVIISSFLLGYSIINIGMSSKNKFTLIACLRFVLVIINNELLLGFIWVFFILSLESVSFSNIKVYFYNNIFLISIIPIIIILLLCFCMETGRTPFDFGESESELISGYITEFSGFIFTLFYLGEYFHLIIFSNIYALLLLGLIYCSCLLIYTICFFKFFTFILYF